MLSLDASGKLGGAVVFSKWKGRNYARALVTPSNPRAGGQVGMRSMLKFLSQYWALMAAGAKATWNDRADAKVISQFNAFVGYNLSRWRNYLTPSIDDPATEEEAAPGAPTTTPTDGVRQISLSIAQGAPEAEWGFIIHRSTTTGFTPSFANCIAIIPTLGADPVLYVDTPLAAGTYYYRIKGFMGDGKPGALEAEVTDTVT
jgi:hypothetical protein